jgi:hypothetical protein
LPSRWLHSSATFEPLYDGSGVSAMGAVLAVVVFFELSAGIYVCADYHDVHIFFFFLLISTQKSLF